MNFYNLLTGCHSLKQAQPEAKCHGGSISGGSNEAVRNISTCQPRKRFFFSDFFKPAPIFLNFSSCCSFSLLCVLQKCEQQVSHLSQIGIAIRKCWLIEGLYLVDHIYMARPARQPLILGQFCIQSLAQRLDAFFNTYVNIDPCRVQDYILISILNVHQQTQT